MDSWYKYVNGALTIQVYVQPGAKSTAIIGLHNGALKIRLNAPAIEGHANEALLKFIAQQFDVPTRNISLERGDKSRIKTLIITNSEVNPPSIVKL